MPGSDWTSADLLRVREVNAFNARWASRSAASGVSAAIAADIRLKTSGNGAPVLECQPFIAVWSVVRILSRLGIGVGGFFAPFVPVLTIGLPVKFLGFVLAAQVSEGVTNTHLGRDQSISAGEKNGAGLPFSRPAKNRWTLLCPLLRQINPSSGGKPILAFVSGHLCAHVAGKVR